MSTQSNDKQPQSDQAFYEQAIASGRPYFGPRHAAFQGAPVRFATMLATVEVFCRVRQTSLHILEIGSWAGGSALTWAEGIHRFNGGRGTVMCIDCWQPYLDSSQYEAQNPATPTFTEMTQAASDETIYELFRHNVRASPYGKIISHFRGLSRDLLPLLADQSFDLVYVDGSHIHEAAYYDLLHAKRIARDGGIVCGDDLELQITLDQVDREQAMHDRASEYSYNPKTNSYYHPGVTLAVDDLFTEVANVGGFFAAVRAGDAFKPFALPTAATEMPLHFR